MMRQRSHQLLTKWRAAEWKKNHGMFVIAMDSGLSLRLRKRKEENIISEVYI